MVVDKCVMVKYGETFPEILVPFGKLSQQFSCGSRITVERFVGEKMTMSCTPADFGCENRGFEWFLNPVGFAAQVDVGRL